MDSDWEKSTSNDSSDASRVADLLASAKSCFRDGQYPQALSETARALQIDPDCIEAYELRMLIENLARDYSGLVSDCTELIRLRPDQARAYINRAEAFIHFEQPERAILDCTKALEIGSDSQEVPRLILDTEETIEAPSILAFAYATRAHAYLLLGLVDEHNADMRKSFILSATPERIAETDRRELVENLLSRAQALMDSGEYGQAVEACSAVLCDEPEHIEARRQRGVAYQKQGRYEESSRDLVVAWESKLEHDRIGRSYVVTLEGCDGEKIFAVFPDTPQGRREAVGIAERLVADEQVHEQLAHSIGQAVVVNVYHAVGAEIEKEDWIWIRRDGAGLPEVVDVDISEQPFPFD